MKGNWSALGKKIKSIRKIKNIPVAQISEMLGVSYTNYFIYERGENHFTPSMLVKLSKLLEVEVDFLVDETKQIKITDYIGNSEEIIMNQDKYSEIIVSFLKDYENMEDDAKRSLSFIIKKIFTQKKNNIINIDEILEEEVQKELDVALKNPKTREHALKLARKFTSIVIKHNEKQISSEI